jgi:hypothetical protein
VVPPDYTPGMTQERSTGQPATDIRVVPCTRAELEALHATMPSQHDEADYGVQLAGQGVYPSR